MREKLMDRMIRLYGFEHPVVVDFCRMAETLEHNDWNDKCLELLVLAHEDDPLVEE